MTRQSTPTAPPPVLVVGSSNFDLTIQTERLPGPSETLLGGACRDRVFGFGPSITPSDDPEADLKRIRDFYRSFQGRHPQTVP